MVRNSLLFILLFFLYSCSNIKSNSFIDIFGQVREIVVDKIAFEVDCFPFFEETKDFPNISMSSLYLSTLATVRPDEQKIVCVSQKHGVLSFCNIVGNQLKEYKQIKYYPPKVSSFQKADSPTIAFSRDNKNGFCGVASDENNVLVLYSGRTFNSHGVLSHHCEHVLIYNWKGEPVKQLILEKPLYSMDYDAKTKTLYGIGYDPEAVILEYDLNGLILNTCRHIKTTK